MADHKNTFELANGTLEKVQIYFRAIEHKIRFISPAKTELRCNMCFIKCVRPFSEKNKYPGVD
jgi:hypothetical protein